MFVVQLAVFSASCLDTGETTAASGGPEGRVGEIIIDPFVLHSFETMARNFVGLHVRTMSLWSGGIYFMAQLLSHTVAFREEARSRAVLLWPRLRRFEALCQSGQATRGVKDFEAHFLWITSPVYREMLALLAHGHVTVATELAWRIFAGIYHEKGSWD